MTVSGVVNGMTVNGQGSGPAVLLDSLQSESGLLQTQFIEGVAELLRRRAKAELQQWMLERIDAGLCESPEAGLFANTCRLELGESTSYLSLDRSYRLVVDALRQDLQYLPACALYLKNNQKNPLGYLLHSLYRQHSQGQSLDGLLYSLANHLEFSSDRLCTQYKLPGKNNSDKTLSLGCYLSLPVLAYASAMRAQKLWDDDDGDDKKEAATYAFLLGLIKSLNEANSGVLKNWGYEAAVAVSKLSNNGGGDLEKLIASLKIKLAGFYQQLKRQKDLVNELEERIQQASSQQSELDPAIAKQQLRQINEHLINPLLAFSGLFSQSDNLSIQEIFPDQALSVELIGILFHSQQALHNQEYLQALLGFKPLLSCLTSDDARQALCKGLKWQPLKKGGQAAMKKTLQGFDRISGVVASIAEAKSADDVAASLDSLASPIGGWKLRQQANLLSINAFAGWEWARSEYRAVGAFDRIENTEPAWFAPIGLHYSWPTRWGASGLFVSLLELGPIMQTPEPIAVEGGRIEAEVDGDFQSVFSPGLYGTWSFAGAPISLGLGGSYGPNAYRTFESADGQRFAVDRQWRYGVFIAVDLVLLPLH